MWTVPQAIDSFGFYYLGAKSDILPLPSEAAMVFMAKKSPQALRLRANPIQGELEETVSL